MTTCKRIEAGGGVLGTAPSNVIIGTTAIYIDIFNSGYQNQVQWDIGTP